ncbi:hypothetical protein HUT19_32850 [Streptomyces sp. NA02950]|uniref:hypothetical protein n=1 Tax=Streptomyces sp. NA02950 TaxID=2742137 RepID=UPI0015907AC0|nr:hypothetical protein [Streptomyces sp. NA02950]QKV95940.1 hypothetical protein HUT19_32850 [Streptomyces sp. NA02950]
MTLPRGYWCQVIYTEPNRSDAVVLSMTTGFPGRAITWLRTTAPNIAVDMDREAFGTVWAWLGDHQGASKAVRELHSGRPYTVGLGRSERPVWLLAHPVPCLPLASTCIGVYQHDSSDLSRAPALRGRVVSPSRCPMTGGPHDHPDHYAPVE